MGQETSRPILSELLLVIKKIRKIGTLQCFNARVCALVYNIIVIVSSKVPEDIIAP